MLQEELTVTEAPKNTDTWHATVACRINIYITVPYIHRRLALCTELAQRLVYGVRCWFFVNVGPLSDSHLDIWEEMMHEILRSLIKLITDHRHILTILQQCPEHLHDTRVRCRRVKVMMKIMLTETSVALLKLRIALAPGDGTRHEQPNPVAYKPPHVIHTVFRQSVGPQCIVTTGGKIVQRIEQCAVKIKDICIVLHKQVGAPPSLPEGEGVDYIIQHPQTSPKDKDFTGKALKVINIPPFGGTLGGFFCKVTYKICNFAPKLE